MTDDTAVRVADFLRAEMAHQHIPGLSLAVVQQGESLLLQGHGWAHDVAAPHEIALGVADFFLPTAPEPSTSQPRN